MTRVTQGTLGGEWPEPRPVPMELVEVESYYRRRPARHATTEEAVMRQDNDHARARSTDPDTSQEAARRLDPDKLNARHRAVLATFAATDAYDLTDDELVDEYVAQHRAPAQSAQSIRSRRAELARADLLAPAGMGTSKLGNRARRWAITPAGAQRT